MSSPHVAGIFALLKQAHPDWSAAAAKSALMTTAYQNVRDNDRVSMADPFDFGAGHVRPGGSWGKGSIAQPGLVYDAGLFDYAAFTCGMKWEVFTPSSCDLPRQPGRAERADRSQPAVDRHLGGRRKPDRHTDRHERRARATRR